MKKYLIFAIALVAGVLVCTSCKKDKKNEVEEPELKGTIYHYHGFSSTRDYSCEHDIYIAMEDNHKMTMKWVDIKLSKDAAPVTFYLYDGGWDEDGEGGFYIGCDATPQLPNGKVPADWESVDISGHCDATICDFDYHINGVTGAIFTGEIVK